MNNYGSDTLLQRWQATARLLLVQESHLVSSREAGLGAPENPVTIGKDIDCGPKHSSNRVMW